MKLEKSSEIDKLAIALSNAQRVIRGAKEDSTNPHFKSNYADLSSIWAACREAITKQELAVIQTLSAEGNVVTVSTMLVHSSGQWIAGELALTARDSSPQAVGSVITYGRRYSLAAMVGVAPEDDDANDAQPVGRKRDADVRMIDGGQFDEIKTLALDLAEAGVWKSKDELQSVMKQRYGKDNRKALTHAEAADLIALLRTLHAGGVSL